MLSRHRAAQLLEQRIRSNTIKCRHVDTTRRQNRMDVSFRTRVFLLKWDDFRAIVEVESSGEIKLYSRRHNDLKKRFPPIAQVLAQLKKQAILDGEIVALDERGHPRFEWLVNRGPQKGTLVYYVFDLLKLRDVELRGEPLHRRKKLLEKLLKGNPRLRFVDHMEREGVAMFAGALALGLEGDRSERQPESLRGRTHRDLALAEDQEQGLPAPGEDRVSSAKDSMSSRHRFNCLPSSPASLFEMTAGERFT
jgi:ATP dependent DNA ligase domain